MNWKEAWTLKDRPNTAPHVPTALAHLGKAAARANDWLRVQQTVRAFHDLRPEQRRGPAADEVAELARLLERPRPGAVAGRAHRPPAFAPPPPPPPPNPPRVPTRPSPPAQSRRLRPQLVVRPETVRAFNDLGCSPHVSTSRNLTSRQSIRCGARTGCRSRKPVRLIYAPTSGLIPGGRPSYGQPCWAVVARQWHHPIRRDEGGLAFVSRVS
jgi:hypothetical protein